MKRKLWKALLVLGLLVMALTLPVTVSAEDSNYTVTITGTQDYDEVNVILNNVNQYREEAGAAPVKLDAELTKMAMQRAAECAVYYSHTRPDHTGCFTIIEGSTFACGSAGENIAYGYNSGDSVSNGWYNSEGHYNNMVNTKYTSIGIGHFYQPGGIHYWVQLFSSASSGSYLNGSGTMSFTTNVVVNPTLAELSLGTQSVSLYVGVDAALQPMAGNAYLSDGSYKLTSGNTAVAKIDGSTVTGVSVGDTTVSLSVTGRKISVPVKVNKQQKLKYTVENNMALVTWDESDEDLRLMYRHEGEEGWWYSSTSGNNCWIYLADEEDVAYAKLVADVQGTYVDASKELRITLAGMKEATITTQPKTTYTKQGATAKTTVKATGDGLKYQWYVKNSGASKYTKSSNTTATYSVKMSSKSKDRRIYCVITDEYGNKVQTKTVYLRMAATITTQPKSVTVASGETAKVTVKATGDGLTYKWYFKNKGASKFSLTDSFKGSSYSVEMNSSRDGRQVYCVVTDKYGKSVQSDTVTLNMEHYAKITTQPKTTYTKQGATAKTKVKATGDGLKYQWYVKNSGASKYTKSSNTTATYSVTMSSKSKDRRIYCVITDAYGNKVQTKTVYLRMAATITTQPKSVTVASGETAKVTVKATGDGLTYKWYFKNKGASKFSLTDSFTGSSYGVEMNSSRNGRQVYCVVTDKYGNSVKSDVVTLKMHTIYLNKSGTKYHYDEECAGTSAYASTLSKAQELGRGPCSKCVN